MSKKGKIILKNGMNLYYWQQPLKAVYGSIKINSGSFVEPTNRRGLAHIVEHMAFDEKRESDGSSKLESSAEDLGLELNASTNCFGTKFPVSVLNSNFVNAIKLVSGIVFHPSYTRAGLKREKEVVLHELRGCYDNPNFNLGKLFNEVFFRGTPAEEITIGKEIDIKLTSLEDIREYHKNNFVANNCEVYLIGGFDNTTLRESVKFLERIHAGKKVNEPKMILPELKGNERFEREFAGISQAYIKVIFRASLYGSENHPTMEIIEQILNGRGKSSLWKEIREKRKAAYSVGACLFNDFRVGYIYGNLVTEPKLVNSCVDITSKILKEFDPSDDEIRKAKVALETSYAQNADNPGQLISIFISDRKYGLDYGAHQRRVAKTSREDIRRAVEANFVNSYNQVVVLKPDKQSLKR